VTQLSPAIMVPLAAVCGYLLWEYRKDLRAHWCLCRHRIYHYRVTVSEWGEAWACRKCDRDWWRDA